MTMRARKRFGQNFLTDESVIQRIVAAVNVGDGDRVFEIGPGHGALTEWLAPLPKLYRAVELDRDLVPFLQAKFADADIINADVLKLDLAATLDEGPGWRIVGNLPYNISSPLLALFTEFVGAYPERVRDLHVMLQREMAERLAAVPGSKAWGRLSVMVQLHFAVEHLFDVEPESFTPAPKVWSSVVRLMPSARPEVNVKLLDRILRMAFAGRRKRLSNSLKAFEIDWAAVGLDPGVRADNVSRDEYVCLTEHVAARQDDAEDGGKA